MSKKKRQRKEETKTVKCDCGGVLRPVILETHDISGYIGFPGFMSDIPGMVCSKCKGETIDGVIINEILRSVALNLVEMPTRLTPRTARFLRRVVGMTQQELATRMNVDRVTVAKWETDGDHPISAQHDMILRVVALVPLVNAGYVSDDRLRELLIGFGAVRVAPPDPSVPVDLGVFRPARGKMGATELR